MNKSRAKQFIVVVCALGFSGCTVHTSHGLYEGSPAQSWDYRASEGVYYYVPASGKFSTEEITFSTANKGALYMHLKVKLPAGARFEIQSATISVVGSGGNNISVAIITPLILRVPIQTQDGSYRFEEHFTDAGVEVEGSTLHRPNAVMWRDIDAEIDKGMSIKIPAVDEFVLQIPGFEVNRVFIKPLIIQFKWSNRTYHSYAPLQ